MNRWVVNRVGLLNFWYYQNQIFELADGRMLLRGTNGSGKSLTMQSLFPVLFDGNTNANRLDSFGSSDRKMEDYLLGEKGVSDRDEGTGYLFLEVKREEREEYLTIGIGMHASRGGRLTKWFFAIENNRRVGIDIELYEEIRKDEIAPLTKKKLINRLVGGGRVYDRQRDYKQFVNERIFGFEDIEQFDELIALLINLRSPKLSKEFRPSVIYGILRGSLPKLKDDELLTLSKTIEQLDGHRERLEDLSNEVRELAKFTKTYQRWQEELTGQVSGKWLQLAGEQKELGATSQRIVKSLESDRQQLADSQLKLSDNQVQLAALEQSIQELNQHEGMNLVQRGQELQEQLADIQRRLLKNHDQLSRKQEQLSRQQEQLEQQERDKELYLADLKDLLLDNEQYLDYLRLAELDKVYAEKMQGEISRDEYDYWQAEVQKKKEHFQDVLEKLHQLTHLKNQFTNLSREVATIQQQLDECDRDMRQWQQTRQGEIEKWKEGIELWASKASFSIADKRFSELFYRMDQLLEEDLREELVLAPIRESYEEARSQNQASMVPLRTRLTDIEEQQQEAEGAIREWQSQKMPEPKRNQARLANRQQLAKDILYRSFYQSVDFLESVEQGERDNLEGALCASGILDGLISEEGLSLADDLQILPRPKFFASTLADYLCVNDQIEPTLQPIVADILQSITVDEVDPELPAIFRNGSYEIANLKGAMAEGYHASYIGAASQERYRQEMILELQKELANLTEEHGKFEDQLSVKEGLQDQMHEDYHDCPKGEQVYQSIKYLDEIKLRRQAKLEQFTEKQAEAQHIEQDLITAKITLHDLTSQTGLALEETVYQDAIRYSDNYQANLRDAYRNYEIIKKMEPNLINSAQTVADLADEVRLCFIEEDEGKGEEQRQQRLVTENLKQQQLVHVEELQAQLSAARNEQRERRATEEQLRQVLLDLSNSQTKKEMELSLVTEKLTATSFKETYWRRLLEKELYQVVADQADLKKIALEKRRDENFNKLRGLENNVLTQFGYIGEQLGSYQPQLLNAIGIDLSAEEEAQLEEFAQYNHYKQPRFSADGQAHTAVDLLDKLTGHQITLRDLLKKDDEELFKSIILESVGKILRSRIEQAMKWVEQMNQLLQSQKNSSGLSLSIQWKPVPSASDQDLGTSKLVELLQKPTEILSEADREAVSRHFQEKVYYAQEQLVNSEDDNSTLFQAIAQALDYRDWFEFEMKFKRANEGYRPQVLSDRKFNQFSGGEKAVAMYLPLFAAVYSRYRDAGRDCPKVITLDEAFAGIDDDNIAELFKACEQLGFNYVMNSQALFGDYPTVSSLMIYELLRPQNINLVTPIRYYWDGHKKHFMLEESHE